jgi:Uma2 family endonuclease
MDSILPPDAGSAVQPGEPDLYLPPEVIPDLDKLVTEDGKAVDNIFVERQYGLLTEPLRSSWRRSGEEGPFQVFANVGWFHTYGEPPFAPDAMLILDVRLVAPPRQKEGRSYFQWLYGKPPDVVIEIVSDKRRGEESYKMQMYARLRLQYYVIFDPDQILGHGVLRGFELVGRRYRSIDPGWLPDVEVGLTLWPGNFDGAEDTWLRWCDKDGKVIPTGAERAEKAEDRLRRLEAQLREKGIEPEA